MIRFFTLSTGFVKTPLALNQIPAQAEQRGITQEQAVTEVMMGKSRIKEMLAPMKWAICFFPFCKVLLQHQPFRFTIFIYFNFCYII